MVAEPTPPQDPFRTRLNTTGFRRDGRREEQAGSSICGSSSVSSWTRESHSPLALYAPSGGSCSKIRNFSVRCATGPHSLSDTPCPRSAAGISQELEGSEGHDMACAGANYM